MLIFSLSFNILSFMLEVCILSFRLVVAKFGRKKFAKSICSYSKKFVEFVSYKHMILGPFMRVPNMVL